MSRNNQTPNSNQLTQLLHHLSEMSQGSTENTILVIAYMSFLSFLAAGIFALLAVLIAPRLARSSPIGANSHSPALDTKGVELTTNAE